MPDLDLFRPLAWEVVTLAESLSQARSAAENEARLREASGSMWTTDKLAVQVQDVRKPLAEMRGLRLRAFYGGAPMEPQIRALREGTDIVVATPGRLIDLGERGELSVEAIKVVVLDEADRMADMGFLPQVEWFLRRIARKRSMERFCHTFPPEGPPPSSR